MLSNISILQGVKEVSFTLLLKYRDLLGFVANAHVATVHDQILLF